MQSGETIAVAGTKTLAEEDALRAQVYDLLANLLSKPPPDDELKALAGLSGDDSELGRAITALARVAAGSDAVAVSDEYHALFVGIGRGELLPYGSYYLTGFLHEKPLAKLREDMSAFGVKRADSVSEPEDHAASVLEVMAGLIDGRFGTAASLEQQKEFCNVITSEATRLSRFIDELLDISSLEAGSLVVHKQRVELSRLLDEVVMNVTPMIQQKQQSFVTEFDEKLPTINADKDKFCSCLVNLIGNASKYTPEQGDLNLRARFRDQMLTIEVQDTGIGIAQDELGKVFEKFYRSKDERIADVTGTGLGLAFVREIVQLHGGQIEVQSELNQGSTFTISLPIA